MNICLLTDTFPPTPGGLAISAQRLASNLTANSHTVHVCAPDQALLPGQIIDAVENGMQVHRFGPHRRADDTRSEWFQLIANLHTRTRFDLLHGYYLVGAGFVTVYAGRYLDLPSIVSARGNDLERTVFDPAQAGSILWALAHATAVTAVSTDLARKARALAPGREVQVVPNGVDVTLFTPAPRDDSLATRLGLDDGPLVGFVGEARLKKGLAILLPAFARVAAEFTPTPRLVLVGGARSEATDILRVFQAQSPSVPVSTIPHTAHADLPSLYNLLDVLALPSLQDGLPNALLEGMACGRAIVASEVGGIPDAAQHDKNSLLVPPGEVGALAEAILTLLRQPEKRAALGQAAQETVSRQFTPARELAANLELYARLTSTARLDTL
ncbi:MAG: glycosyltransferase family 4 protein [Anaerolineales bacterium]|nr:glycosyltransferase family 4 protein [Anaerolineales bacterium]